MRPFSFVFVLLLAAIKIFFVCVYKYPLEDIWHHQTLGVNFANGYGVTYLEATVTDLSKWKTTTVFKWPPLVSVLIGSISQLTKSTTTAIQILDGFSILLIVLAYRKIVSLIPLSLFQQWVSWFLFLLNPVLTDLLSTTDLLSLAFWSIGFAYFVPFAKNESSSLYHLPLLLVVLFLPAAFRYQYYPIIFTMPLALLLIGWRINDRLIIKKSLAVIAGLAALLSFQFILLSLYGTEGIYLADQKSFSPENLTRLNPFFTYSFLPVYQFLNYFVASQNLVSAYTIAGLISLVLFILFLLKIRQQQTANYSFWLFRYFSFTTILSVFFFLCALSLSFKKQVNGATTFTYVQEARYWAPVLFLVPLMVIAELQRFHKLISYTLLILILAVNGGLLTHRLQKTYLQKNGSNTYAGQMKHKRFISDSIQKAVSEKKLPVVLSAFDSDFAMGNSETPYAVANNTQLLQNGSLSSSKQIWFFLITRKDLTESEKRFVQTNRLILIGQPSDKYCLFRNQ
jgi:hypothetical protein